MTGRIPDDQASWASGLLFNMGACAGSLLGLSLAVHLWAPFDSGQPYRGVALFAFAAGLLLAVCFNVLVRRRLTRALECRAALQLLDSATAMAACGMLGLAAVGFGAGRLAEGLALVGCIALTYRTIRASREFHRSLL